MIRSRSQALRERAPFARRGSAGWEGLLAVLALAFLAWFLACTINAERQSAADDAYITYVYGRNVADGHGLRYNASDSAATSGCSTELHLCLSAAAVAAGIDPLVATRALAIACMLWIALVFGWAGRTVTRVPWGAAILASACVVWLWSVLPETAVHLASGMETLLFTAAHATVAAWASVVVARSVAARRAAAAQGSRSSDPMDLVASGVLAFAMLILARPEGWLLCAGYVAAIVLAEAPQRGLGASLRAHADIAVALAVLVAGYFIGRKLAYGEFIGNPYYVKSANRIFGSRGALLPGLSDVWRFAALRFLPLAIVIALIARWLDISNTTRRAALWLALPATAVLALYSRAIHEMAGGFRYEYPMLVPLLLGVVVVLLALRERSPAACYSALIGGAVCLPLIASPVLPPFWNWVTHPRSAATVWLDANPPDNALARAGLDLAETGLRERATVLLSAAGQIPWYSRLTAVDWVGLNDTRLSGRTALSMDEVWQYIDSRHPDVVQSILPPASLRARSADDDANFRSANVQTTLDGRGSALFKHWDRARVAAMFYREMQFVRDQCEFGACYKLGDAWGDDWWVFLYVRKDSPHREKLLEVLRASRRTDRTSDLSRVFASDPRTLGQ